MRVSKRDFIQYTSKWLKETPIIITNRGIDEYKIERCERCESNVATRLNKIVATKIEKEQEDVATKLNVATFEPAYNSKGFSFYGCGCTRNGKALCEKHGRA
jgi:hypothetical protein